MDQSEIFTKFSSDNIFISIDDP